jgi:protein-tyrosine kinase
MSLIEQALERLKVATAQRDAQPPAPVLRPVGQLVERPTSEPLQRAAVESPTGTPCRTDRTVRIDLPALRAAGLIAPEQEERQLAEEYRIIKRPLLAAMSGATPIRFGNVIVVTSALPGEGKTFTCINLALSLALERDREVVLVDGDVAKPQLSHLFGLDNEPGVLDVMGAPARSFDETIVKSDFPSLYLLPAGRQDLQATEILRSDRASALLALLASDPRRIILIDSPPLLVTSEAGVITTLAGQVVLVVRAAHTPQAAVVSAIEGIAEDKPVSLVLNQADSAPERSYAYYGRYGYDRSHGKPAASSADTDPS